MKWLKFIFRQYIQFFIWEKREDKIQSEYMQDMEH